MSTQEKAGAIVALGTGIMQLGCAICLIMVFGFLLLLLIMILL